MRSLLQLKVVFGLKYRQLGGFASSLLGIMGIEIRVPSYSQISPRAKQVEVKMGVPKTKGPMFIVLDSTGLKVYGEGEWKVRKHGYNKRQIWRKLHSYAFFFDDLFIQHSHAKLSMSQHYF